MGRANAGLSHAQAEQALRRADRARAQARQGEAEMSRSSKKGPWVEQRLLSRVEELNAANSKKMLRTWSRALTIFPELVGHKIDGHDGRRHSPVFLSEAVVG